VHALRGFAAPLFHAQTAPIPRFARERAAQVKQMLA